MGHGQEGNDMMVGESMESGTLNDESLVAELGYSYA